MRDIYELIRQKESEFDRIKKEVDALRIAARLLDDGADGATRVVSPTTLNREAQPYGAPPVTRPSTTTPAVTPTAWASAKQFP